MLNYTETVTIRLPEGTLKRTQAYLEPRQTVAEFWREIMLRWLSDAERRERREEQP